MSVARPATALARAGYVDQAEVTARLSSGRRALEQAASAHELEDAEDKAALADWRAREAAGQTSYVPHDEALRRLGLAG